MARSEDFTDRWFVIRICFDYLVCSYSVQSEIGDFSDQSGTNQASAGRRRPRRHRFPNSLFPSETPALYLRSFSEIGVTHDRKMQISKDYR